MKHVKLLSDRILVEAIPNETTTAGGIIIPDSAQKKSTKGKVIVVGNGTTNDNGINVPLSVKVGDTVLFTEWSGTEVNVEGKKMVVIKESDILLFFENNNKS